MLSFLCCLRPEKQKTQAQTSAKYAAKSQYESLTATNVNVVGSWTEFCARFDGKLATYGAHIAICSGDGSKILATSKGWVLGPSGILPRQLPDLLGPGLAAEALQHCRELQLPWVRVLGGFSGPGRNNGQGLPGMLARPVCTARSFQCCCLFGKAERGASPTELSLQPQQLALRASHAHIPIGFSALSAQAALQP